MTTDSLMPIVVNGPITFGEYGDGMYLMSGGLRILRVADRYGNRSLRAADASPMAPFASHAVGAGIDGGRIAADVARMWSSGQHPRPTFPADSGIPNRERRIKMIKAQVTSPDGVQSVDGSPAVVAAWLRAIAEELKPAELKKTCRCATRSVNSITVEDRRAEGGVA